MNAAIMWRRYAWRGHEVIVVQQWADPFGRRMVRIADAKDDAAIGMSEDAFLADATPLACDDDAT